MDSDPQKKTPTPPVPSDNFFAALHVGDRWREPFSCFDIAGKDPISIHFSGPSLTGCRHHWLGRKRAAPAKERSALKQIDRQLHCCKIYQNMFCNIAEWWPSADSSLVILTMKRVSHFQSQHCFSKRMFMVHGISFWFLIHMYIYIYIYIYNYI